MQADPLLTLAFIERKPAAAARILQDLDTADAAEFLGQAPARLAGPVLEVMVPWAAASCMELLDPETAAGLIQTMTTQGAASILRLLPDELRNGVLELLSRSRARAP